MTTKEAEAEVEETETEEEETHEESHEGGAGVTLQGLADKVDALASRVAGLGRGRGNSTGAGDGEEVASQVRSEVAKIKAAEDRKRAAGDRIGEIEAKIKAITERPPREYRPITKWMWGEDDG